MKIGFFQSAPDRNSSTKLQSFLAFFAAVIIAACGVFVDGVSFGDSFPMVVTLLAYSMGSKAFQQALVKFPKDENKK